MIRAAVIVQSQQQSAFGSWRVLRKLAQEQLDAGPNLAFSISLAQADIARGETGPGHPFGNPFIKECVSIRLAENVQEFHISAGAHFDWRCGTAPISPEYQS